MSPTSTTRSSRKSTEAGEPWWAWSLPHERATTEALDLLGVLPATYEPRATGHIVEMVELMDTLVEKGHAYAAADGSGDVYFDVRSWPATARSPGRDRRHGPRRGRRPARQARPARLRPLEGPQGRVSRPRAVAHPVRPRSARLAPGVLGDGPAYLGDAFDIHGGGVDLRFPHHENEQAQSRAAGWVRELLAAQRLGDRRGGEDGQVPRQRPGDPA
jgi:cysteinyl-tRNA synthetase